mmetsp:Transcript_4093/g.7515  ORF Transcript_4093/g.7515 Transcript_4093/m.7515 type:complete len:620 (-) Transcript_4093:177-2036(-)
MDASTIILEYVCPIIGIVLATQMFLAPFKDVQKAIKSGSLGELNPLPWVFMLGNCIGWVFYSYLTRNFFLFAGNITGLIVSIWFNLSASNLLFKQQIAQLPDVINIVDEEQSGSTSDDSTMKLKQEQDQIEPNEEEKELNLGKDDSYRSILPNQPPPITELPVFYTAPMHDYQVMAMSLLWIIVFSVLGFGDSISTTGKQLIVGVTTNLCLVFFYGAPLSSIAIVLKTRNTATLHVPTMFTNTASSVFWGVYGAAVLDFFVMVPNLLGALLGFTQIVLYMIFPRVETTTVPVITAVVPKQGELEEDQSQQEMEVVQLQLHNVAAPEMFNLTNHGNNDPSNNPMAIEYAVPADEDGTGGGATAGDGNPVTTLHKREISMDGVFGQVITENPLVLQYASDDVGPGGYIGGIMPPVDDSDPPVSIPEEEVAPPAPAPLSPTSQRHRRVLSGNRAGIPAVSVPGHRRVPSGGHHRVPSGGGHHRVPSDTPDVGLLHRRVPCRGQGLTVDEFAAAAAGPSSRHISDNTAPGPEAAVSSVHHKRVISNTGDTSFLAGIFAGDNNLPNVGTTTTATLHRRIFSGGGSHRRMFSGGGNANIDNSNNNDNDNKDDDNDKADDKSPKDV